MNELQVIDPAAATVGDEGAPATVTLSEREAGPEQPVIDTLTTAVPEKFGSQVTVAEPFVKEIVLGEVTDQDIPVGLPIL
jgi:hypothetical protein